MKRAIKMLNTLDKIRILFFQFMENKSVRTISAIPMSAAIILVAGWIIISQNNSIKTNPIWNTTILFAAFFLLGTIGVVYIYKKEMPGLISSETIKGGWAIISGILLIVFFWGIAILGVYLQSS
jgi:uncharacterized membrane protein YozB (DUF420 family)